MLGRGDYLSNLLRLALVERRDGDSDARACVDPEALAGRRQPARFA